MKKASFVVCFFLTFLSWSCQGAEAMTSDQIARSVTRIIKNLQQGGFQNTPSSRKIERRLGQPDAVYVALRESGKKVGEAWADEGSRGKNIGAAIYRAGEKSKNNFDLNSKKNTLELVLTYDYEEVKTEAWGKYFSHVTRGIYGIEMTDFEGKLTRVGPTQMITANRSFKKEIDRVGGLDNIKTLRRFRAHQMLVPLSRPEDALFMYRGNRIVTMEEVHQKAVENFAEGLGGWLVGHVQDDGRMTYKYWPSRGKEASSNNMIRQWMASVSLVKWANHKKSSNIHTKAEKNIKYNLQQFYRTDGDLGFIEYRSQVKLGSAALAALSILEHPKRTQFQTEEVALQRFMDYMQQEDGSFKTFYKIDSNRNQNYYPGETLFYWAHLYTKKKDKQLLEKIMKSFRYYRSWHRENLNPAFVPWHTEAYYMIWQHTKDTELRDFIFEMNDWLLEMQQWESAKNYPDTQGRFYNPKKSYYGPPHASATGVYLEGLIDAYRLALKIKDRERRDRYRKAILRGLRSSMQLQFQDEVDMFYISKRDAVKGGMRTTVYDNSIRVDNIQHTLMAVIKILNTFGESDYP